MWLRQNEFLYKLFWSTVKPQLCSVNTFDLHFFCSANLTCFCWAFFFFPQTHHGYAWFLPFLDLFAVGTYRLYPPNAALPVTVLHLLLWQASVLFSEKGKLHMSQKNISSMNVWRNLCCRDMNILKSIYELCVLVLGCSREEPQLYSNVLQSRQFYFSIKNVLYGCLVQE